MRDGVVRRVSVEASGADGCCELGVSRMFLPVLFSRYVAIAAAWRFRGTGHPAASLSSYVRALYGVLMAAMPFH